MACNLSKPFPNQKEIAEKQDFKGQSFINLEFPMLHRQMDKQKFWTAHYKTTFAVY